MDGIKLFLLKHWKLFLKLAFAFLLLFLILKGGSEQIKHINIYEITQTLRNLSLGQLSQLILFGLVAAASMTLYDYAIIGYFKHSIKPLLFFNIAFVANSLNNLLGMGGLAGATARTILLRKNNLDLNTSIYYNVLLTPATPTGLSLIGLWLFLTQPGVTTQVLRQYPWLYLGIVGVFLILPAYFFSDRLIDRFQKKDSALGIHRSVSLKLRLVGISFVDWMAAFLFFWFITTLYGFKGGFAVTLGIYALAAVAGIMSFLPGGIGSFDLIALIGLQQAGMTTTHALAVLILFRIFFFFVPAFASAVSLLFNLSMDKNEKLFTFSFLTNLGFFNSAMKYYKTYSDFINVLLSGFVFSSGVVLLGSAVRPGIEARIVWLAQFLPHDIMNMSQMASIVIGFLLCVLSIEILYKVERSYTLAIWLLALGAIFTFFKGLDFEEGIFLIVILVMLKASKPSFFRHSIPIGLARMVFLTTFGLVSILLYFTVSQIIHIEFLTHRYYPIKLAAGDGEVLIQSAITFAIFSVFLFVLYLKKPRIEGDALYEATDMKKLAGFLENDQGGTLAHLMFLGDKQMFWAADGNVVIPYAKYKDHIVVLGDPIGDMTCLSKAIQEFQGFLDKYGYEPVFYEVSNQHLSTYHDNGYYFFKLGEEAIVDLEAFNMAGASKSNLRHTVNSFGKKGYVFEVLDPPFDADFFSECRAISDEWLGSRREMGFSMGWYNETYLQRSQIATLRDVEGRLLAFVSLMPCYDGHQSMSTDLMRLRRDVPHGTMDFVFLSLISYLKENNYKYFNLGMAPLSNVGLAPYSHFNEKIARFAFQYGKFFYSFDGLRKFKEKYNPIWKPRYLAFPQLLSLPATILEISMLISSRKMKVE